MLALVHSVHIELQWPRFDLDLRDVGIGKRGLRKVLGKKAQTSVNQYHKIEFEHQSLLTRAHIFWIPS
jgi:hypothetical protein